MLEISKDDPARAKKKALLGAGFFVASLASLVVILSSLPLTSVQALPSFARQTGEQCTACHTNFLQLTPFGRDFKLGGYVMSSGQSVLPHIAGMVQPSFTNTGKNQPGGAAPHFGENNNLALTQASIFYGGIVVPKYVGAFAQFTYDGVGDVFGWDNLDIRFAHATTIAGQDITFGVTANNSPSVSDLWNTTPVWGFPFSGSGLAPTPAAGTLVEGGLGGQVLGIGGYAMINDTVYLELDGYKTLSRKTQTFFGVNPTGENQISGISPYWRVAVQHNWDSNALEVGTFGLSSALYPGRDKSAGTDRLTDVGVDAQYQFLGNRDDITLLATWIAEYQHLNASMPLGLSSNVNNMLYSFKASAQYMYDKTYAFTVQYFRISGDSDPALYGTLTGSPNSDGFLLQLDWMPFNKNGGPAFWPMSNVKFSLLYTIYTEFDGGTHNFDGAGRNASDNNTLYLQAWFVF